MPKIKTIDDSKILEKALLVICEKGADCFTLADIGKAVGLAPATLLQRFGSKRELLIRAAKQTNIKQKQDLKNLKKKGLNWKEELIELMIGIPEGMGTRQEIANSLSILKLDMIDPELHQIARELFECFRAHMEDLIYQGQECGDLIHEYDANSLVWELDALRHGLIIQWTLSGKGTLQKWMQKGLINYLGKL